MWNLLDCRTIIPLSCQKFQIYIPCGFYGSPNEQNWMCKQWKFSQIQSHIVLCSHPLLCTVCLNAYIASDNVLLERWSLGLSLIYWLLLHHHRCNHQTLTKKCSLLQERQYLVLYTVYIHVQYYTLLCIHTCNANIPVMQTYLLIQWKMYCTHYQMVT